MRCAKPISTPCARRPWRRRHPSARRSSRRSGWCVACRTPIAVLDPGGIACTDLMQRSAATNPRAIFVGLIEPPGISRCNNRRRGVRLHELCRLAGAFRRSEGRCPLQARRETSRGVPSSSSVNRCIDPDGVLPGLSPCRFRSRAVSEELRAFAKRTPPAVVLFNARGEILSASVTDRDVTGPAGRPERSRTFSTIGAFEFSTKSRAGERRDYAVVPIAPGRAYAFGSMGRRHLEPSGTLPGARRSPFRLRCGS
jgi:hypothetical protein